MALNPFSNFLLEVFKHMPCLVVKSSTEDVYPKSVTKALLDSEIKALSTFISK